MPTVFCMQQIDPLDAKRAAEPARHGGPTFREAAEAHIAAKAWGAVGGHTEVLRLSHDRQQAGPQRERHRHAGNSHADLGNEKCHSNSRPLPHRDDPWPGERAGGVDGLRQPGNLPRPPVARAGPPKPRSPGQEPSGAAL